MPSYACTYIVTYAHTYVHTFSASLFVNVKFILCTDSESSVNNKFPDGWENGDLSPKRHSNLLCYDDHS